MPLKAAIFDLDGTLIDSEPFSYSLYQALIEPYGHELTPQTYVERYCGHTLDMNLRQIIGQFELPLTVNEGFAFFESHGANAATGDVPLKPGVAKLLAWLEERNVPMALGSASGRERAFGYLDRLGVGHYFCTAAYGSEVERGKPAPDIFLLAARRLGVQPEECVVFEDSESGVIAGAEAGMCVLCTPDMRMPTAKTLARAYACLTTIDEAISLLEGLMFEE